MNANETVVRQRLEELERKHAKAIEKLQRAERSKLRRKTFHGYTQKDPNADGRKNSSTPGNMLCQNNKSSSTHKNSISKSVSFKDTIDTDQALLKSRRSGRNEPTFTKEISRRRSSPSRSCTPKFETKSCGLASLRCGPEDCEKFTVVDKDLVMKSRASVVSSEKTSPVNAEGVLETKRDLDSQQQDCDFNVTATENCCVEEPVSIPMSIESLSDNGQEICLSNNEMKLNSSVEWDKETDDEKSSHVCHSSANTTDFVAEEEKTRLQKLDKLDNVRKEDSSCSEEHGKPSSIELKQNWMHLFEEEFPRRSPRLRSTPNFANTARVPQTECNNHFVKEPAKTKPARSRKSRSKRPLTSGHGEELLNNNEDTQRSLRENQCTNDLVFPRPSSQQTRTGGLLSVVVDFSLPDKEFAKLKLAKIKSTLTSTERIACKKGLEENGCQAQEDNVLLKSKCELETKQNHPALVTNSPSVSLANSVHVKDNGQDDMEGFSSISMKTTEVDKQLLSLESTKETEGDFQIHSSCGVNLQQTPLQVNSFSQQEQEETLIPSQVETDHCNSTSETLNSEVADLDLKTGVECINGKSKTSVSQQNSPGCDYHDSDYNDLKWRVQGLKDVASQLPKTEPVVHKRCGPTSPCKTNNKEIFRSPEQGDTHVHVLYGTQGKSNLHDSEPNVGEVADLDLKTGVECISGNPKTSILQLNSPAGDHHSDAECKNISHQEGIDSKWSTGGVKDEASLSTSPFSKTEPLVDERCGPPSPFETRDKEVFRSPEQGDVLCGTPGKSSLHDSEPNIGDQATPHGKMDMPSETSQVATGKTLDDREELSPVLMMACLQHHTEGDDNAVRSLSLSSYEPSTESGTVVLKKRDVVVVCLAHLVVIWTTMPGLQWTVLHKWTLPTDSMEEFVRAQFVPFKSHIVLLVGGNFQDGNGRVLGYSEDGDYFLDLAQDDERASFSAMCFLSDTMEDGLQKDVEFIIGARTSSKVILTKWSLDNFCLSVKRCQSFTPICSDTECLSLQPVHGSHCLFLGTTVDKLFLWNHKLCQQLKSIDLCTMGLGQLSCLNAVTRMGLLFLMMASKLKGIDAVETNSVACSLYALNPRTLKMVCLDNFFLPSVEKPSAVGSNGQYFAVGCQESGKVYMWNIINSDRHATLQVFQDEVSSIGFHDDRPLAAFGSTSGCVHLFSLC